MKILSIITQLATYSIQAMILYKDGQQTVSFNTGLSKLLRSCIPSSLQQRPQISADFD